MLRIARRIGVARPEAALSSQHAIRLLLEDVSEARARSPELAPDGPRCNGLLLLPDQLRTGWSVLKLLESANADANSPASLLLAVPN